MSTFSLVGLLFVLLKLGTLVGSSPSPTISVPSPPEQGNGDLHHAIGRELSRVRPRDREWKNSTSLDKSWDSAVLLQLDAEAKVSQANITVETGIEVICTTCYLKGVATAELSISSSLNISQELQQLSHSLVDTVENFTEAAKDFVEGTAHNVMDSIFDDEDFKFPTFDFDFNNVSIEAVPDASLRFSFDGLELYMLIDTTLSLDATYTLNLFNSGRETAGVIPIGLYITDDLQLGLIFTVDLILAAHADIDVSSGFHLLLDDGFAIDIALFGEDASSITHNGGRFEFLPVEIESAGAVFSATLRVGAHAGLTLSTPDGPTIGNHSFSAGGGIEVGVFANVAEFTTNVTAQPDSPDCPLQAAQSYQLALGAAAGATVAFDQHTWGPVATTSVPIFTTELASACISKGRTRPTPTDEATPTETDMNVARRDELSIATTTTATTYTGVNCLSAGLVNCPVSLQSTVRSSTTSTMITAVPSGMDEDDIVWPAAVQRTVTSTAFFNKDVMRLPSTSGSPVSYVPPPTSTSTSGEIADQIEDHVRRVPKPVIIGVSVGLGVPLLTAIILWVM
ncbi:hypothetical protein PRZ48_010237 [Zasmidium cellare]|uniref:Mid2 domain-containing protein n=1 Tax=Zasmidium cellare TaxID=395010 RepID=A0ABR0EDY9_ZASCE|nr:hypothetical protein PRZ48_010237 [Zasmidium cellare]